MQCVVDIASSTVQGLSMPKTPYEKEAEIEKQYDKRLGETLISGLVKGDLNAMDFIQGVKDLKKEKDAKVLFEAGLLPKTHAPKAVAPGLSSPTHRQGVN